MANVGAANTIELDTIVNSSTAYTFSQPATDSPKQQNRDSASALAPVDGGIQAWTFIASAFVIETLVWGFGFT
jgi:hypothetical protein